MNYNNSKLILESKQIQEGNVSWKSPSNIALIKYWGKYGKQLPRNPSISLTLDTAASTTKIAYSKRKEDGVGVEIDFFFHGKHRPGFASRIEKYLESLIDVFPFLKQLHLRIESSNSFPHSAGIASSASAMSALALCLCSMEAKLFSTLEVGTKDFYQKASYLSRLGSGSACRSVYPYASVWGETAALEGSSNLYAIPVAEKIDPIFRTFHDDILIISKAEKSVSSTAGHNLMEGNIYAENRFQQARDRMGQLLEAMKIGDLETFGAITESEALTLHALMMTSSPPYLLMEPNTIEAIKLLQAFRAETKLPVYFTLDAGPNLHILYPNNIATEAQEFIENNLGPLCQDGVYIKDKCGVGPVNL